MLSQNYGCWQGRGRGAPVRSTMAARCNATAAALPRAWRGNIPATRAFGRTHRKYRLPIHGQQTGKMTREEQQDTLRRFAQSERPVLSRTRALHLHLPSGVHKVVTQSVAITRHAGKLGTLYAKDSEAALLVAEIMDLCHDALGKTPGDPDAEVKKKLREEYAEGKLKAFMTVLSDRLGDKPFFAGEELTVADLIAHYFLIHMIKTKDFDYVDPSYVDQWPNLAALYDKVEQHPVVTAYFASLK